MTTTYRMLLLAAVAVVLCAAPALAFHDEGVAHCNGCHTMHNSYDGDLVDPDSPDGNEWLLVDATPSDTCLGCHETGGRGVLNGDCLQAGGADTPEHGAGNYIYLSCSDLRESTRGTAIHGDGAGHNLDAPGFGVAPDGLLTQAPGGTFPADAMGCTSCHDPHGTFSYRLLYGARMVQGGLYTFTNPPPEVEGISLSSTVGESPTNHAWYKSGMSEWCSNCHGDFHNIGATFKHPNGTNMGSTVALTYNRYNGSDDITGGVKATAYWPEVPFEDPLDTDYGTTSTVGPRGASDVACITCHRAHATSAEDAGRWDFNVTFIEEDGDAQDTTPLAVRVANLSLNAQRSLCNKCHKKDVDDEIKPDTGPF